MRAFYLYLLFFFLAFNFTSAHADDASIPEVMMNQYLVASNKNFSAIQTYGVATCIVVTLYDSYLKQGALLHLSASSDIKNSIELVLQELGARGSQRANLKAQILGGWADSVAIGMGMGESTHYDSQRMAIEILAELQRDRIIVTKNMAPTEWSDIENGRPAILNIEINLTTGDVYLYNQDVDFSGGQIGQPLPNH